MIDAHGVNAVRSGKTEATATVGPEWMMRADRGLVQTMTASVTATEYCSSGISRATCTIPCIIPHVPLG
jgi:hypothetical protein